MSGKEVSDKGIWRKPISRRTFIRGSAISTGGLVTAAFLHGVSLNPYGTDYPQVTPDERELLKKDQIHTIAHYAGNSEGGIRSAAAGGYDFADGDLLINNGQIFLTHAKQLRFLSVDVQSAGIKVGLPDLTLERGFEVARQEGIGMFLEFKRGKYNQENVRHILDLSRDFSVNLLLLSNNYDVAQMAVNETGNPSICIFNPYELKDWRKFLDGQIINTILTNPFWINQFGPVLESRKSNVFVNEINDLDDAAVLATKSFVRGFMYNPGTNQPILTVPRT